MRIAFTFVITLVVVFDSIELSSQSSRDALDTPRANRFRSPPSRRLPQSSKDHPQRARSMSPAAWPSAVKILGYSLRQLGYIRLKARTNENLQFEFRRYVFPEFQQIRWRGDGKKYSPVPTQEHLVLSTSNGDIFAILEYSSTLRGIYKTDTQHSRVKINMLSGEIDNLTPDEIKDCPVGKNYPIFPQSFIKGFGNYDSLLFARNPNCESYFGSPPPAIEDSPDMTQTEDFPQKLWLRESSKSPPGRPPSDQVLGYALGQLGYIRLIPYTNTSRQFEFRRFVFPIDNRIRLLSGKCKYVIVPNQEHIVLSTSHGDVFAILEYTGNLRGIYKRDRQHSRIKFNMVSHAVDIMTTDEMKECQLGKRYPIIPHLFTEVVTNCDSLQTVYQ